MTEQDAKSPLERAARALCEANGDGCAYWRSYVVAVRAVLMAIREPSEGMLSDDAVFPIMNYNPEFDRAEDNATKVYQAMIDAALGE